MDNKIFITLGSQKFQFNRLLKAIDELQGGYFDTVFVIINDGFFT